MSNVLILIPPSEGKAVGGEHKPLETVRNEVAGVLELIQGYEKDAQLNSYVLDAPTMPAIKRYTGVVYKGIDYDTLEQPAQSYLNVHLRIVSAMFGLVKPNEFIPNYKIQMDKLGLTKYWYPILSKKLRHAFVIDLLPQVHRKAISYENGVAVDFAIFKNGKKIPAGHNGKLIKGKFIRWLAQNRYSTLDELKQFCEDGFVCDQVTPNSLVFTKK